MNSVQAAPGDVAYTVLIPARMGSSRLPGKPLADIAGIPMIVRVAQRAKASGAARCVVAADDPAIIDACMRHGVDSVLTGTHHPSGTDRLAEAAAQLGLAEADIVVNVQGDEPLLEPALIDAVARCLDQHPGAAMATAACEIDRVHDFVNPNVVKVVVDRTDQALYFSRAPIPWDRDRFGTMPTALPGLAPLRHIGIYAYRVSFLRTFPALQPAPIEEVEALEQLRALWHGARIVVHRTQNAPAHGVDTPDDLARVRALLAGETM